MENKKVKITELKIKLEKLELTLTPIEAKELYEVLGELFEKETIVVKEYIPPYTAPYPYDWYYPYFTEPAIWNDRYTVWCENIDETNSQTLNITSESMGSTNE